MNTTLALVRALTPDVARYKVEDLPEHLACRIKVDRATGCWLWTGPTDKDGYGKCGHRGSHRVIWEHLVGPIAPKLDLDHREDWGCASKACGYPGHLLDVTHRENMTRDGARGVGAENIRKTRCGTCGTPYDKANTYIRPDTGSRGCRTCNRAAVARYQDRLRVADAWDALLTFGRGAA